MTTAAAAALVLILTADAAPQPQAFAPSPNPVSHAARARVARDSKSPIAAAELLPASRYVYQPTPAQMTFSDLIAQYRAHEYRTVLGGVEHAGADESAGDQEDCRRGRQGFTRRGMSRATALVTIIVDWADHYSTAALTHG